MFPSHVPVLIVGGGVVGLSTALFLAEQGVQALVVEKHAGTAIHPRARGFHASTIELFGSSGLADEIDRVATSLGGGEGVGVLTAQTLAGPVISFKPFDPVASGVELSPRKTVAIGQDRLEPMILAAARRRGAEVHFRHEMTEMRDEGDHVTAEILDRETGARQRVAASWLVAADGVRSTIRESLGIKRTGYGSLGPALSTIFSADFSRFRQTHPFVVARVMTPDAPGMFIATDIADRWIYGFGADDSTSLDDHEAWARRIRLAAGVPDLPVTIHGTFTWEPAERVAERFVAGRILLAGDAAHQMAPSGGHGANTGIHDAANLAWKLAAVLSGASPAALLATYDAERRPVAQATARQSLLLARRFGATLPGLEATDEAIVDTASVVFGYRYGHSTPLPRRCEPRGDPGTRAPHVALEIAGRGCSTVDLFGARFVLLAGDEGWRAAAEGVAPPVTVQVAGGWQKAYGVGPSDAVLVRPDGIVAARLSAAAPAPSLRAALDQALARR